MNGTRIRVVRDRAGGVDGAVQWHRNGDHPLDLVGRWRDDPLTGAPYQRIEGAVVRFYRSPDLDGDLLCRVCGQRMHDHGWIDLVRLPDRVVHPGDWVTIPDHGVGAFNHGYVEGACGDDCNNGECRTGQQHDRCTLECLNAPLTLRRFIAERLAGDTGAAAYALRGIYAMHHPSDGPDGHCDGCHASFQEEPWTPRVDDCQELRFIGFVWQDHPEYDRSWAPRSGGRA